MFNFVIGSQVFNLVIGFHWKRKGNWPCIGKDLDREYSTAEFCFFCGWNVLDFMSFFSMFFAANLW